MSPGRVASPTLTSEAGALPRHRLWPARGGENSARGPAVPSPSAGGRPQGRWRWGCYSRVTLQSSSLGLAGASPLCFPCHLLPLGSTQVGSLWGNPAQKRLRPEAAASHVLCAPHPASGPHGHLSLAPLSAPVGCLQSLWSGTHLWFLYMGLGVGKK